jgi:predicted AlkP superfamily phosphohydrolase/phosphomutase
MSVPRGEGSPTRSRRLAIVLLAFAALVAFGVTRHRAEAQAPARAAARFDRVIVLGIDGVDYRLLRTWMDEGRLPNFRRLAGMGGLHPLQTSMPPQSPVAWSNFITGMNSGGHGIFDFIHRDPRTLLPFSSMSEVRPPAATTKLLGIKLPSHIRLPGSDYLLPLASGTTENLRQGKPFWKTLGEHGVPTVIQRAPVNFPPLETEHGRALSGMGTPDMQGTLGTYAFYTDAPPPGYESFSGGKIFPVDVYSGKVTARLYGPPNDFIDYDRMQRRTGVKVSYQERKASVPFTVYIDAENPVAKVVIDGKEILLEQGVFGPWVEVRFHMLPNPGFIRWAWHDLVGVTGMVRFYLKSTHPDFGLYVSPVQISPMHPALPISSPEDYAPDLAEAIGPFYTQGLPEDTKALDRDIFNNDDFMKQADLVVDDENRMAQYELERFRSGLLFLYFSVVDQIGHAMWRTMRGQETHPAHRSGIDDPYADVYEGIYEELDGMVGRALEHVDDRTCLIVMSDHGFSSWRRAFDLNRWLLDNGYLALKPGVAPSSVSYLQGIDWNNTRLYAIGINGLYVNQLGRERYGIVPPGPQKAELLREVASKLEAIVDPVNGERPILKVFLNEEIYSGPLAEMGPDAQVGYNRGYRASDESAVGEVTDAVLSDNHRRWSGDHCQDYREVPGVILSNVTIRKPDPALTDMAPSILTLFGVPVPDVMKGTPIF